MHLHSSVLHKPFLAFAVLLHTSAVSDTASPAVAVVKPAAVPAPAPVPAIAVAVPVSAFAVPVPVPATAVPVIYTGDLTACSATYTASPEESSAEAGLSA